MPRAGIVIAGAGVIGCSIAWHLASRGVREVLVVDRHPSFGGGSTAKATGGFRTQFGTAVNVQLSLLAREKLLRFEEETGVDPGYDQHGYLFLATTEGQMAELRGAQKTQHACGLAEAQCVDRGEIVRLNPHISDQEIIGGTFCPTDGFIKPMEILCGYSESAMRMGVRFEFNREIGPLDPAVTYVNAAGAWAGGLCSVPVAPLRRRAAATEATAALPRDMPMTIWAGDGFHLRVRDDRVLLLWPDYPPDDDRWMQEVITRAHKRIPALRALSIDKARCWSGLYEMSPDKHAILGAHPDMKNVYLANGSSGHGVMHAPAIGQLIAEMIIDGRTTLDVHALRPSRFAEGDAVRGPSLL